MGWFERGISPYFNKVFTSLDFNGVLVETGTFEGLTIKSQIPYFEELHTIEAAERYFAIAKENLNDTNVFLHFGESPKILETLLPILRERKVTFFLDAHFSSGDTFGDYKLQPLMKELEVISHHRKMHNTLLLIDDARLLNGHLGYPILSKVLKIFSDEAFGVVVDDILMIAHHDFENAIPNPNDFSIQASSMFIKTT